MYIYIFSPDYRINDDLFLSKLRTIKPNSHAMHLNKVFLALLATSANIALAAPVGSNGIVVREPQRDAQAYDSM